VRVVEERGRRPVQRVGIDQRAAADARRRQHDDVLEQGDPLDAPAAERRRPEKVAQVPRRLRQGLRGESAAGFEHADPVALLGEPQGAHTAAEAAAHDHDVVIRHQPTFALPAGNHQTSSRRTVKWLLGGPKVRSGTLPP
jgi:hypothetical protein